MSMILFTERDIAIDMGTDNTLLFIDGKGLRLREPTVVAVDRTNMQMLRVGEDARKMLGRTPANSAAVQPIRHGVISDYDMATLMLKELIKQVTSFSLFKPRVLMTVPGCITGVEERAVIDACIEGGCRKVYLTESSLATAYGAGLDVNSPNGQLIMDIGSGTTEIAVISEGGVVESASIKTAGGAFDDAIIRYIRRKFNVLIGRRTAEDLKMSIGCVKARPGADREEVKGRCLITGLPRSITVTAADMAEAVAEPTEAVLDALHSVLERTPPELVADISENGVVLSGGGSLLYGFDALVTEHTGIPANVVDDPLSCTCYGAGRMLTRLNNMSEGMINLARRKQIRSLN